MSASRWTLPADRLWPASLGRGLVILGVGLLVLGNFSPTAQAQEVTTDRWLSVEDACPNGGAVQIKPAAILAERKRVKTWRVELRVPEGSACSLPRPRRLHLVIDGSRVPGAFAPADGAAEAQLAVSGTTARKITQARGVRIVENAIDRRVPDVFQADLRRLMKKASAIARRSEGSTADEQTPGTDSSAEDEKTSPPKDPSSGKSTGPEERKVFRRVDESPSLVGGPNRIQKLLQYPDSAKAKTLEGRVFVELIVTEKGRAQNPKVVRGAHKILNEEALRVVRKLRFEPGRLQGEPVKTRITVPVTFRLPDEE
ncbi:MAG: energy transducer TonB [Salinibacter sp.]